MDSKSNIAALLLFPQTCDNVKSLLPLVLILRAHHRCQNHFMLSKVAVELDHRLEQIDLLLGAEALDPLDHSKEVPGSFQKLVLLPKPQGSWGRKQR